MKWTEVALRGVQPLQLGGKQIGTVERRETPERIDGLTVQFDASPRLELSSAVDVAEQLECPRVFVIEGVSRDTFLLLGGEKVYWLTSDGAVKAESQLFRKWGEEEYWKTQIIERGSGAIVIYEAGVLAIDETLAVRWHKSKLLNDEFVAVEGNALKFARDHDAIWFMLIEDGNMAQ